MRSSVQSCLQTRPNIETASVSSIRYDYLKEKYHPKSKDHLAEKGDTARHGNIQEAGISKGERIDENHRPTS